MKLIKSQQVPLNMLPEEDLAQFYKPETGEFVPPKHKYSGRVPCLALYMDDCLGSNLFGPSGTSAKSVLLSGRVASSIIFQNSRDI